MDNIKKFIKENRILLICSIIVVIIALTVYYITDKQGKVNYNPGNMENTPYAKKEYAANEYINVDIELIDLLNEYYSYFLKKKLKNPEEAYEMLTKENKEKYESLEGYEAYVKKTTTINTPNNKITKYRKNEENNKQFDIIDSENNKYSIIEHAIWDIEIVDNGKA